MFSAQCTDVFPDCKLSFHPPGAAGGRCPRPLSLQRRGEVTKYLTEGHSSQENKQKDKKHLLCNNIGSASVKIKARNVTIQNAGNKNN